MQDERSGLIREVWRLWDEGQSLGMRLPLGQKKTANYIRHQKVEVIVKDSTLHDTHPLEQESIVGPGNLLAWKTSGTCCPSTCGMSLKGFARTIMFYSFT